MDTSQDASYYGTWANPFELKLVNYCEGDVTESQWDTEAGFVAGVRELERWAREGGYWRGIDGMCNDRLIARFRELGLGDLLH